MSQGKRKVQIRGIYSTALTNLLMDYDFLMVQPSVDTQERFDLVNYDDDPDVHIKDSQGRHGIVISGEATVAEEIVDVLFENLLESIFFRRSAGVIEVEFPLPVKRRLDDLRDVVTPTLSDHHYYKAFGGEVGAALDMAERLLSRGESKEETWDKFQSLVSQYLPFEGFSLGIDHVKLNGFTVDLGKARIREINDEFMIYEREMRSDGVYDGLNVRKEAGDIAISRVDFSEYSIETRYYSKEGSLRGTYYNINTPVEVYSSKIRYVDLEVDVMVWTDGRSDIVDVEDLRVAESRGTITSFLARKGMRVAEEIVESQKD